MRAFPALFYSGVADRDKRENAFQSRRVRCLCAQSQRRADPLLLPPAVRIIAQQERAMATDTSHSGLVRLRCVCGGRLAFEADLLGRVFRCPHCRRYLRAALQFLLVRQDLAPNLTALCTCGRFIVEPPNAAGTTVTCRMCGQRMVLPSPTRKLGPGDTLVRISPKAIQRQMNRAVGERRRGQPRPSLLRLSRTAAKRRLEPGPGQTPCVNPGCRLSFRSDANVCPHCGVNRKTGHRYAGPGPERDPKGKWKRIRPKTSGK